MLTAKINVMKIDKARLFKGKEGAQYLDLVLIPTPNDKYGNDYMILQSITKEEREAGVKAPMLGNAKVLGQRSGGGNQQSAPQSNNSPSDDLPW